MMTCRDVQSHIEAYYDEEGDATFRQDMAFHLAGCAACRLEFDQLGLISKHVFPERDAMAPPFLWTRVLAAIEDQEQHQTTPWWIHWRWMSRVAIAATLLVGLGSTYLLRQSAIPLESALQGRSIQQHAIQFASAQMKSPEDSAAMVLEEDSWTEN